MQLNITATNTINRVLAYKYIAQNIIYDSIDSIIDQILLSLPYNFFAIRSNMDQSFANRIAVSLDNLGMYNYSIYITNSIEKAHDDQVAPLLHIPTIVIVSEAKIHKKEDRYILNQKTKHVNKIFLSEELYEIYGKPPKSHIVPFGFASPDQAITATPKQLDSILLDSGNPMVNEQIKQLLLSNNINCEIVSFSSMNKTYIDYKLAQSRYCIDISSRYRYNLLYAMSLGCCTVTLSQNPKVNPYTIHLNNISDIVSFIKDEEYQYDTTSSNDYLVQSIYSNKFLTAVDDIIKNVSKEVYIK